VSRSELQAVSSSTYRAVVINSIDARKVLKDHQRHASEQSASGVRLPDLLDFGSEAKTDARSFILKLAANGVDFPVDVFVVFWQVANVGQNAAYFLPATLLCQEARRFGLQRHQDHEQSAGDQLDAEGNAPLRIACA